MLDQWNTKFAAEYYLEEGNSNTLATLFKEIQLIM